MDYDYLEELLEKTKRGIEWRNERLLEYEEKVATFSEVAEKHSEIKDLLKDAKEWVTYINGANADDEKLIDILYTARDLRDEK